MKWKVHLKLQSAVWDVAVHDIVQCDIHKWNHETLFQLAAVLIDSCAELCQVTGPSSMPVLLHPVVSGFKKRAAQYVSSLDQVTLSTDLGRLSYQFSLYLNKNVI